MSVIRPSSIAVAYALVSLFAIALAPGAPALNPNAQFEATYTPTPTASPTLTPTHTPTATATATATQQAGMGPVGPGSSSGDPHLLTLDGLPYDFQAAGEFIGLKSTVDNLEVQLRQQPYAGMTVVSINTAVAINVAGDRVGLYVGGQPPLRVNGQPVTLEDGALPLPGGGRIERQGDRYSVVWPDQTAVKVMLRGQYLDVVVRLATGRQGRVSGLLGNADGNPANDLTTRTGVVVDLAGLAPDAVHARLYGEFGNSWRITQSESLFDYGASEGTHTFALLDFPSAPVAAGDLPPLARSAAESICRGAGVTAPAFLAGCTLDVGLTGDAGFAASAAEVAAEIAAVVAPAAATRYQGGLTNPDNFWAPEQSDQGPLPVMIHSFRVEFSLDPATNTVSGGSLSYQLDYAHQVTLLSNEMAVVTDRVTFVPTQPATGIFTSFPDGGGGEALFTGTLSVLHGRSTERAFGLPLTDPAAGVNTVPNETRLFGFVIDPAGQLLLCFAPSHLTMSPDPLTRQRECADKAFAVLQPVG